MNTKHRFTVDPAELLLANSWFNAVEYMSPDEEGVTRPAFSAIETQVLNYLADQARAAGLVVTFDAGQNAIFSLPEDTNVEEYVLIGSHVDTVPMGGNFDGLAGVLAGLLCLIRAQVNNIKFKRPVKVIAMRGEESAWFGPCYIASKALFGVLSDAELTSPHKNDGRTLSSHMSDVGINMEPIIAGKSLLKKEKILEYIELHIEQGPLLIGKDMPAAVVSAIRGNIRHKKVRCIGEAGHSGAVPRAFRKDPVLAMANLLNRLDESWLTILQKGDDLVLTSGIVSTDPKRHAMSRIPDEVGFSLDIRSQSQDVLDAMTILLKEEINDIECERRVKFDLDPAHITPPALMDTKVVKNLEKAMSRIGLKPTTMASGGGHDAAIFANAGIPTAMIFVRNQNGSHNPLEAMKTEDFLAGTSIIYEHLTGTS
tara:strand:- start:3144 stop:4421 length:1278 start_codon:yes stop_codon:yes gene_type:complete